MPLSDENREDKDKNIIQNNCSRRALYKNERKMPGVHSRACNSLVYAREGVLPHQFRSDADGFLPHVKPYDSDVFFRFASPPNLGQQSTYFATVEIETEATGRWETPFATINQGYFVDARLGEDNQAPALRQFLGDRRPVMWQNEKFTHNRCYQFPYSLAKDLADGKDF